MRILDPAITKGLADSAEGSSGAFVSPVGAVAGGSAGLLRLEAGGRLASQRVPAIRMLAVTAGEATITGGRGATIDVHPGEAVVFDENEAHEVRSAGGMLGVVVDGITDEDRLHVLTTE